jgi:hypothetical protein
MANGEARIGLRIELRHAGEFETAKAAFLEIRSAARGARQEVIKFTSHR